MLFTGQALAISLCPVSITGAIGTCELGTDSVDISTTGSVTGNNGADNFISNIGGNGGYGISNAGVTTPALTNNGIVTGGNGGYGNSIGGTGGNAISNSGTITDFTNNGNTVGGIGGGAGSIGGNGGNAISNSGTITNLTNIGNITGGNGGIASAGGSIGGSGGDALLNNGTITNLTNIGIIAGGNGASGAAISGYGGNAISNSSTITNLINGQTGLTYTGFLPSSYYTYFSNSSTYGTTSFSPAGSTTLSNYGLRISAGQNYAAGTYTGVIASDSTLTISAYEPVSGVTYHLVDAGGGLSWNLVIDSVTTSRIFDAVYALGNTPAFGAAAVIDANPNLLSLFSPLTTNQQISDATSQTLPVLTGGSALATFDALSSINHVIQSRQESNLGLSSGDDFYGDRRVWLMPFGSWAKQDDRTAAPGFDANTWGVVLGADATPSTTTRLGVAFAYANSNVDSTSAVAPQSNDVDVYQLIGYGSTSLDADTELNFQIDGGQNRNSSQRLIALTSSVADASYDSYSAHAGIGIGRSYTLSEQTRITPSVRADYTWIKDESYSETGAGVLNLNVGSRSAEQLILALNGKLTHAMDTQTSLTADLGVGYDLINDQAQITSVFAGAPGASFVTYGIDPSPWIGRAGLGVVHTLQGGMEITARYDLWARQDFTNQTASIKARWAF